MSQLDKFPVRFYRTSEEDWAIGLTFTKENGDVKDITASGRDWRMEFKQNGQGDPVATLDTATASLTISGDGATITGTIPNATTANFALGRYSCDLVYYTTTTATTFLPIVLHHVSPSRSITGLVADVWNVEVNEDNFSTSERAPVVVLTGLAFSGGGYQPLDVDLTVIAAANNSAVLAATTASFTTAEQSKLTGIEALADVTDTTNVTAAGALMDSEVTNLAAVKAFAPTDYATAAQGGTADTATQPGDNVSTLTNDAGYTTAAAVSASYQPLDGDLTALAAAGNSTVLAATTASFLIADETKLDSLTPSTYVTKVGTPVNNQIGVWTGDGTIEGTATYTFDGSTVNLDGAHDINDGSNTSTDAYKKNGDSITPWINVKTDHGASGTDTDDTSAINAAIAAANATSYGAVIFFPPGIYRVYDALTTISKSGVHIVGAGRGTTTIKFYDKSGATTTEYQKFYWYNATQLDGGGIRDLSIDGSNNSTPTEDQDDYNMYCLAARNIRLWKIENVFISDIGGGIYARRFNNVMFSELQIDPVRAGGCGIFVENQNGDASADVAKYTNVVLAGGAGDTTSVLWRLKGAVHSHYINQVQLLRGGTGLKCENAAAGGGYPFFINGSTLDIEYCNDKAIDITKINGFYVNGMYVLGTSSDTGDGSMDGCTFGSGSEKIYISQLICQGLTSAQPSFDFNGCTYVFFDNCLLTNCPGGGIDWTAAGNDHLKISNSVMGANGTDVAIGSGTNSFLTGNWLGSTTAVSGTATRTRGNVGVADDS